MEGHCHSSGLVRCCSVAVSISQELPSLLLGHTGGPVILNHEQMFHGNSSSHKTVENIASSGILKGITSGCPAKDEPRLPH